MKSRKTLSLLVVMVFVFSIFAFANIGKATATTTEQPETLAQPCFVTGTCDDDSTSYSWEDSDPETPWGIERIYDGSYYGSDYTTDVDVAILDTGIDLDHPDLQSNIAWSYDATGGGNADDKNGHGSHVSGTVGAIDDDSGVVGVYSNVDLYAIKVLGNGGRGDWDDLIAGINAAVAGPDGTVGTSDDADVISMSLGASSDPGSDVHNAIKDAYNSGVTLVAAAGNDGDGDTSTTELGYPAAYDEVIAVAATDKDDSLASFSNSGSYIDFAAPGVNIYSTYKGGGYDTLSGTSMACPHVSGLVAIYLASGGTRDPSSAFNWLQNNAIDLGPSGHDNGYGYGLVQAP